MAAFSGDTASMEVQDVRNALASLAGAKSFAQTAGDDRMLREVEEAEVQLQSRLEELENGNENQAGQGEDAKQKSKQSADNTGDSVRSEAADGPDDKKGKK